MEKDDFLERVKRLPVVAPSLREWIARQLNDEWEQKQESLIQWLEETEAAVRNAQQKYHDSLRAITEGTFDSGEIHEQDLDLTKSIPKWQWNSLSLTPDHLHILYAIHQRNGITQQKLLELYPTLPVVDVINRLLHSGFIQQEGIHFSLTKEGAHLWLDNPMF
ncbi:MAG: hypothetical protein JWM56_166 [Candidatus Peribacteria bacterium]|nr:hypothetical protein [Candidatus Peribacteria bacterium]